MHHGYSTGRDFEIEDAALEALSHVETEGLRTESILIPSGDWNPQSGSIPRYSI